MAGKNGRIGGIRSVFWRRAALVTYGVPLMVLGFAPEVLKSLPRALADARDAFAEYYAFPAQLFTTAIKDCWSKDWKITE